jgi:myosin heavy subunit
LQLIGGATETLKKKLRLKALKNYRYLNMSSEVDVCPPRSLPSLSLSSPLTLQQIDGVNNKVNFATLKQAMTFVGMSAT